MKYIWISFLVFFTSCYSLVIKHNNVDVNVVSEIRNEIQSYTGLKFKYNINILIDDYDDKQWFSLPVTYISKVKNIFPETIPFLNSLNFKGVLNIKTIVLPKKGDIPPCFKFGNILANKDIIYRVILVTLLTRILILQNIDFTKYNFTNTDDVITFYSLVLGAGVYITGEILNKPYFRFPLWPTNSYNPYNKLIDFGTGFWKKIDNFGIVKWNNLMINPPTSVRNLILPKKYIDSLTEQTEVEENYIGPFFIFLINKSIVGFVGDKFNNSNKTWHVSFESLVFAKKFAYNFIKRYINMKKKVILKNNEVIIYVR